MVMLTQFALSRNVTQADPELEALTASQLCDLEIHHLIITMDLMLQNTPGPMTTKLILKMLELLIKRLMELE